MRFGLDVARHQPTDEIPARMRYAEDAGSDGAWVFDHSKPSYGDPSDPCLGDWTLPAAIAAATRTIRLSVLVTGATHRHSPMVAAEAATIDRISSSLPAA